MSRSPLNRVPTLIGVGVGAIALMLASCGASDLSIPAPETPPDAAPPAQAEANDTAQDQSWLDSTGAEPQDLKETTAFYLGNGSPIFSYEQTDQQVQVLDDAGQVAATLIIESNQKLRIEDPNQQVIGYVMTRPDGWRLRQPDQTEELFVLTQRDDGNFRMRTGAGERIYRINARDYGYEVQSPEEVPLFRVRDTALHNAQAVDEPRVLYTEADFSTAALFSFALDQLSFEQQTALAYAIHRAGQ